MWPALNIFFFCCVLLGLRMDWAGLKIPRLMADNPSWWWGGKIFGWKWAAAASFVCCTKLLLSYFLHGYIFWKKKGGKRWFTLCWAALLLSRHFSLINDRYCPAGSAHAERNELISQSDLWERRRAGLWLAGCWERGRGWRCVIYQLIFLTLGLLTVLCLIRSPTFTRGFSFLPGFFPLSFLLFRFRCFAAPNAI